MAFGSQEGSNVARVLKSTSLKAEPLVGVVTPVFNGEPYLEQCIESVLNQTYDNWEYVIVNNASTDRSIEIARAYAAKDARIRVYDCTEFVPQARNHNRAIALVSPDARYVKTVQADDWIFPECLERMVAVAEQNPSVGLVSSYQLSGTDVVGDGLPFPSSVLSGREVCRLQLIHSHFFFGSPTAVLIRGEVVRQRNPFYVESALHCDTDAAYSILKDWDFGFVHQVLTFYRTDNIGESAATRHLNPHGLDKFIVLMTHGRAFLDEDEFEACLGELRRRYFRVLGGGLLLPSGWHQYEYHRNALRKIGFDLTLGKLLPYVASEIGDIVLNPKKTAGRLLAWHGKRKSTAP
jgi:glycosyltransferase involved in cell wall biosynthesis